MPEPTPAETIRAAATRLRNTAERATEGPWRVTEDWDGRWFVEPVAVMLADPDDPETWYDAQPDAAYIALVSPVVGKALADWLDENAGTHQPEGNPGKEPWGCRFCYPHDGSWPCTEHLNALAVARALLAPSGEEGGR